MNTNEESDPCHFCRVVLIRGHGFCESCRVRTCDKCLKSKRGQKMCPKCRGAQWLSYNDDRNDDPYDFKLPKRAFDPPPFQQNRFSKGVAQNFLKQKPLKYQDWNVQKENRERLIRAIRSDLGFTGDDPETAQASRSGSENHSQGEKNQSPSLQVEPPFLFQAPSKEGRKSPPETQRPPTASCKEEIETRRGPIRMGMGSGNTHKAEESPSQKG